MVEVVETKAERTLIVAGSGVFLGAVLDFEVDSRLGCSCGIGGQQEHAAQGSLDGRKHVGYVGCCDFK